MARKKRFASIYAWVLSFFSPALYRDVGTNWRGIGLFYLFLLLAICWIPLTYKNYNEIIKFANDLAPMADQVPSMKIEQGHFSIEEQMPYHVKFDGVDKAFVTIDTTGATDATKIEPGSVLITETKIISKDLENEVQTINIPKQLSVKFSPEMIKSWKPNLPYWAIGITYVMLLLGSWLYRILLTFFYAAIGGIFFFDLVRHHLNYKALLRITAVAMTPAIILSTVQVYVGYEFPYQWLAYFGISMFYLLVGIVSNKAIVMQEQPKKNEQEKESE